MWYEVKERDKPDYRRVCKFWGSRLWWSKEMCAGLCVRCFLSFPLSWFCLLFFCFFAAARAFVLLSLRMLSSLPLPSLSAAASFVFLLSLLFLSLFLLNMLLLSACGTSLFFFSSKCSSSLPIAMVLLCLFLLILSLSFLCFIFCHCVAFLPEP